MEAAIAQFKSKNKDLCSLPSFGSTTQSSMNFSHLHDHHAASSNRQTKHPVLPTISPVKSTESFQQLVSVDGVVATIANCAECSTDRCNKQCAIYTESMFLTTSISSTDIAFEDEQLWDNSTCPHLFPAELHKPLQKADLVDHLQLNSKDNLAGTCRYWLPLAPIILNTTLPHYSSPFSSLSQNPAGSSTQEIDMNIGHHSIIRDLLVLLNLAINEWNVH